jgi:hypothetical protein
MASVAGSIAGFDEIGIEGVVELAGEHFFALGHEFNRDNALICRTPLGFPVMIDWHRSPRVRGLRRDPGLSC